MTPWEKKGLVMRMVMEWAKDREVLLVDGVKVLHDDGWAWCSRIRRSRSPTCGPKPATDADARARAQEYARRIRNVLRS